MKPEERDNLNSLAIEMSHDAGKKLLKVPGVRAVMVTMVGDEVPLGVIVYDKKHQGADTLLNAIARLSEHISVLTHGLTGEKHGQAANGDLGREEQVQGESDVCSPTHNDSPEVPRPTAEGQQGEARREGAKAVSVTQASGKLRSLSGSLRIWG